MLPVALTLMLLMANLVKLKLCEKIWKWLKPWHFRTHLIALTKSFPITTNMTQLFPKEPLCKFEKIVLSKQNTPPMSYITLPMLRLLSSKAQARNDFWKPSKPCHVGIHWKILTEYSQMSAHMPGFQWVFRFFTHFVLAKLATSSIIRVKHFGGLLSSTEEALALKGLMSQFDAVLITFVYRLGHSNLITCLTSFFWKKNPVRLQKKRKKSHLWCLTDKSGFEIFCQTPKKKKKKCKF